MVYQRKLLISVALLVATGLAGLYLFERYRRPPESARMLPEGDLLMYANLRPVHLWDLGKSRPVQLENEYREFVEQTGIQFERDLDEIAMSRRDTKDGRDVESSEVFVGRFDANRLKDYLQKKSVQVESYRGHSVYLIPNEGHKVRVAVLDGTRVAVTNMASADPLHGIIDRYHHSAAGPSLLDEYYGRVPAASLAWIIDHFPAKGGAPQLPGGLSFSFLEDTTAVASLRYNRAVLFRADVVAASEADAKRIMESALDFLAISQSVSSSLRPRGSDPDVKAALQSIQVEQQGNAAVFTASFPERILKKILSESQPEGLAAGPSAPEPQAVRKR